MKKIMILILMAFVVNAVALAQTYQEVVYLKNGSVIRGVIVEQIPSVSLKIQTADGSIFAYQMDEVEKITKEEVVSSTKKESRSVVSNPYAMKTGYRGFVDVAYSLWVGYGDNRIEFSTSHGYQIFPCLFAGIGVGVHYYYGMYVYENNHGHNHGHEFRIPIFADIRGTLPCRSICQPFLDFKVGYTVYKTVGFYMNPSIGCRFAVSKICGINVGVGYTMQKEAWYHNNGAFTFRVGFDF